MTAVGNPVRTGSNRDIVRPKKMADMVANRIRQMIARGEISEGQWLPTEPRLMEQFGVSRPTLREAFRLLEADSLVSIRRGPPGGARVTFPGPEAAAAQFGLQLTLSKTTIQDVYEARMIIEPAAANLLAKRGSATARKALAAELESIKGLVDSPTDFGAATVRFHQKIVELAGNKTLATVVAMLREVQNQHVARLYGEAQEDRAELIARGERAFRAFAKLVDLINARDGDGAEKFWIKHMKIAQAYVLKGANAKTQVVDLLY